MKKNTKQSADNLVQLMRDLIRQETNKLDHTVVCRVCGINSDNTYNIYIEPDDNIIINNIPALSNLELKQGDFAYLYKIQNQLNNSFIIKKIGR